MAMPDRARSRCRQLLRLFLVATAVALVVVGCGESPTAQAPIEPPATPEGGVAMEAGATPSAPVDKAPVALAEARFASFSPAMTQMLVDLGLGGQVVGRTPFCDSVPASVKVVGSLLDADYERLLGLKPTHLVVQPAATGTDPELERLAATHGWVLVEAGLDSLRDVEVFLRELVPALQCRPGDDVDALKKRALEEADRIARLLATPRAHAGLRTILLVGTEPLTAAGQGTFVSEMFESAGGHNAVALPGYPELSFEELVALDPEAILILRELPVSDDEHSLLVKPLRSTATTAARTGRIDVHVDPAAMLPSTRAASVVAALAARLAAWREPGAQGASP